LGIVSRGCRLRPL